MVFISTLHHNNKVSERNEKSQIILDNKVHSRSTRRIEPQCLCFVNSCEFKLEWETYKKKNIATRIRKINFMWEIAQSIVMKVQKEKNQNVDTTSTQEI